MSFEQVDLDRVLRFDNRMLGSVGSAPHTAAGPESNDVIARPQLSLVSDRAELAASSDEDDQWQDPVAGAEVRYFFVH